MATSAEFKDFVLDCLERAVGEVGLKVRFETRKMFGEYCVYAIKMSVRKVLFLLCDEQVFAKKLDALNDFVLQNASCFEVGYPFDGAKEHYIVDVENAEVLGEFLQIFLPLLPEMKPKNAKNSRKNKNLQ